MSSAAPPNHRIERNLVLNAHPRLARLRSFVRFPVPHRANAQIDALAAVVEPKHCKTARPGVGSEAGCGSRNSRTLNVEAEC